MKNIDNRKISSASSVLSALKQMDEQHVKMLFVFEQDHFVSILTIGAIEEDAFLKFYAKHHPLGFGTPSDIANGCIYLLSDASRWVTGSVITIDGGYTLQ